MSAETLRRAAADIHEKVEAYRTACAETSPEVHGGPDAHWAPAFLENAILGHPHVVSDDPEVVRVVRAGADALAPWHPVVALAVADWLWEAANHEEIHGNFNCNAGCLHPTCRVADRALTVARAYLGEQA